MSTEKFATSLFWFRRDLRSFDNAGLHAALTQSKRVHCVFVFDRDILDALKNKADRRVEFIWDSVSELRESLRALGGDLYVLYDVASAAVPRLARELDVDAVFTNHDYEPQAVARDATVTQALKADGITFLTHKDHVVFEKDEVLTQGGKFFSVFTPYKNAWLKRVDSFYLKPYPIESHKAAFAIGAVSPVSVKEIPTLEAMGFKRTNLRELKFPTGERGGAALFENFEERMDRYDETRNFPAVKGPSYLSTHLRFGTVSIRGLARAAYTRWREGSRGAEVWLSELIWRDFYSHILHHNPRVVTASFKPEYDNIAWSRNEAHFQAWCEGKTGYPIVDAAMRQLNQTGYMHNRLRMVAASFLTKDLLIDWRWGERYFAETLNDFDLSANNGGWQWAASSGCDAQPYFRIFNPNSQSEKFDAEGTFIRKYVPEVAGLSNKDIHAPWLTSPIEQRSRNFTPGRDYPLPIVDHATARLATLAEYKRALARTSPVAHSFVED
ncbi:MAG: deoxyribodipyrimidine photo-lyase [Betaproteobacteria bacterium]|nr:MAG: deoxyribodipyrimidine photo-lyase [Betaproteobacteria bacterium]